MRLIEDPKEFSAEMERLRGNGSRLGFVPTMGALHDGHLELVKAARAHSVDLVALSIFVNPLQFGPSEDFARYPRDLQGDAKKASEADIIFAPKAEQFYAPDFQTRVELTRLTQTLEGARRPGHFAGVATVVLKLLILSRAHAAFFGEKDYQQLLVIKQLARDLALPIEIHGVPTVREPSGLALSSRNQYLSPNEREDALVLSQALQAVHDAVKKGERQRAALVALAEKRIGDKARLDYFDVVDAETLEAHETIASASRALVAGYIGKVRLIDNLAIRF